MASTPTTLPARKSKWLMLIIIVSLVWQGCKEGTPQEDMKQEMSEEIKELPYSAISLTSLESMETSGENWQVVGGAVSDFQKKHHIDIREGTGVLLNNQTTEQKAHIFTGFDHGDIELDIEFLMPKGSNSGIYFQSRYEVQLLDSWMVEEPGPQDCGGIYERWDPSRPDGQQGYEGHPPRINAAKAPGLWQHFHIKFRAPRFDAEGNKTANAIFEEVIHNGVKIHENVEVTGPTRAAASEDSEVPLAPLMIQGDHGPVAFRNIKFKLYEDKSLTVSNLTYDYYEMEDDYKEFPPLDSLPIIVSDTTSTIDVDRLSRQQNDVAFRFKGDLNVVVPGDYLFFLSSYNTARLFIDDAEIIAEGQDRALVNLTAGTHDIRLDYYNSNRRKLLFLEYEGPNQRRAMLGGVYPERLRREPEPLHVDPQQREPEMIRAFVSYKGDKLTHAISVGDPARMHYSYDLKSGSLLKVWRGGFADMSQAWINRGTPQLLVPQGMSVILSDNGPSTQQAPEELPYRGYAIDGSGRPTFRFANAHIDFQDSYQPSPDGTGLIRSMSNDAETAITVNLAVGDFIQEVREGCFLIDGDYYLEIMTDTTPEVTESNGKQEMSLKVASKAEVKYAIIW